MSSHLSGPEAPEPFAAFLAFVLTSDLPGPDAASRAFAIHLTGVDVVKLPKAAQPLWLALVTRLLKAPADQPLSPRAISGIASWPAARVGELTTAVQAIEAEIARAANDRLADDTNTRVSRSYL